MTAQEAACGYLYPTGEACEDPAVTVRRIWDQHDPTFVAYCRAHADNCYCPTTTRRSAP